MSNVVYLKSNNNFNEVFICYVYECLKSITTYKDCCMTKDFNDTDEFNHSIEYDFKVGYVICDKSEFYEALNNFKNNLNLISDKL